MKTLHVVELYIYVLLDSKQTSSAVHNSRPVIGSPPVCKFPDSFRAKVVKCIHTRDDLLVNTLFLFSSPSH